LQDVYSKLVVDEEERRADRSDPQVRNQAATVYNTLGRAYTHCSNLSQYETHGLARPTRNARVSRRDRPEQQTFTLPFHFHKHAQEHAPPVYTFPIDSQHHQSIDLFPLQPSAVAEPSGTEILRGEYKLKFALGFVGCKFRIPSTV
jgi:hypothetical protein